MFYPVCASINVCVCVCVCVKTYVFSRECTTERVRHAHTYVFSPLYLLCTYILLFNNLYQR
jgi:hypothetical protein